MPPARDELVAPALAGGGPALAAGAPVWVAAPPTLRASAHIGGLAAANVALALLQQWYVLRALGPGPQADALYSAFVVPNVLLANAMTPVTQVLVPLLAVETPERFRATAWTFFGGLGALFAVLAALLCWSAPLWLPWTLPGFDAATVELAVQLLRMQSPALLFAPLSLVLWSIYQARSRFLAVELSTGAALLASLALIAWGLPRYGVAAAAAGFALKPALQTLFLAHGLGRPQRPRWTPSVAQAWQRLRPLLAGISYCRTDQIVDRSLASLGSPGSITLLFMAQQIYAAANTILGKALVGPLAPSLAAGSVRRDWSAVGELVRRRLALLVGLALLGWLGIALLGPPLLAAVFGQGRFEPRQLDSLWQLLLVLGGAFLAFAPTSILSSAFYAAGETRTPALLSSAIYTGGLLLRGALFYAWGVLGIAAAISAQMLVTAVALGLAFRVQQRRRRGR